MDDEKKSYGYGKRPLWQWIVIYLVIGGIIYGLVYYFILAKRGGYNFSNTGSTYATPTAMPSNQPTPTSMPTSSVQPTPTPSPLNY